MLSLEETCFNVKANDAPASETMLPNEPASAASVLDGDDAKALQEMMSVMSRKPLEVGWV